MQLLKLSLALLCLVVCTMARPRYIAIPVEDIQFLSFAPSNDEGRIRVSRQAPYAPRTDAQDVNVDSDLSESRLARQAGGDGHDYVDYGAHTGHHGAFGWYADYPVHHHER